MCEAFHIKKLNPIVDLLVIHKSHPERYPFLLESVANGDENCRYSILFAFPQSSIRLNQLNDLELKNIELESKQFISGLNEWFEREQKQVPIGLKEKLPFYGGWFVYLGYELAEEIEPVLNLPQQSDIMLPVAMATRIPAAIIVDKLKNESWLISEPSFENLIIEMDNDIQAVTNKNAKTKVLFQQKRITEEKPSRYIQAVKRIKEYIIDGDVFQVNISRKWKIDLDRKVNSSTVYAQLCKSNPAPFAGLMLEGSCAVVSSSPERLVSVKNGIVQTRPIAGTRPRCRNKRGNIDQKADDELREELINHPKERAEHVMLIDLERNDLGRVSKPGSVVVDELMVLESYEHVHHIVSNVKGELIAGTLPGDVISAVFPGGTITGCPKVRCMQIIGELEGSARQAYTGSMGYVNIDGDMDLNILIRTIIHSGNQLHIRAGAGIVAYSDPEKELQETRIKAKGMLDLVMV